MSGPIVRSGASPEFSKNWEKIFGKKSSKTSASSSAPAAKKSAKAAKKAKPAPKKKGKK
jgi:hypothetical protein